MLIFINGFNVTTGFLPGSDTSFQHTTGNSEPVSCYILIPLGGGGAVLGFSPVHCILRNVQAGQAPATFSIKLESGSTARLNWSAVPGASGYTVMPVTGGANQTVAGTTTTFAVSGSVGCFQVSPTLSGGGGTTNILCTVTGIGNLSENRGMVANPAEAARKVQTALPVRR